MTKSAGVRTPTTANNHKRDQPTRYEKLACEYNMKNHHGNIATNRNYPNPRQEKHTRGVLLSIARLPKDAEKSARPGALEELRSSSLDTEHSWEHVDNADWHSIGDIEMANKMLLVPVESITKEQYRRFSEVVLPSFGGHYEGFSGPEMPPLDWIKRNFIGHIAVVQYWRR